MMNIEESMGEPSTKRQENGDESTGSERPHKKARFAWQVKGKLHLKDSEDIDSSKKVAKSELSAQSSRNFNSIESAEQNLERLGDYLLNKDFSTLDSVITDPDKSLLKPSGSVSFDRHGNGYPRYISSIERNGLRTYGGRREEMSAVPMSMVNTLAYTEDQYIARWQARQMAKGFVDNTINRVLDTWMIGPLQDEINVNRHLAHDVAEFINNLPGDNSIENEGILMAISAHGLQNQSSSSGSSDSRNKQDRYRSRASSSSQSDDEMDMKTNFNEDEKSENATKNNFNHSAWTHEDETEMNNPHEPFSLFAESSPLHFDNDNQSSTDYDDCSPNSDSLTSHYTFMDAAVSYAIQNKGLASFGSDHNWISE